MIRALKYLFMITAPVLSFGQSAEWKEVSKEQAGKVFEKVNNWFKNTPAYSLNITHASYESYTSLVPAEKSEGYFKKQENNYHSFLLGIHTVQNISYRVVIDTTGHMILVAHPDKSIWEAYTTGDYATSLESCLSVKASETEKETRYRLEFSEEHPLQAYELIIGKDGLLKEVISYYRNRKNEDGTAEITPRLSITFSGYNLKPLFVKNEFDDKKYFTDNNNMLALTKEYKDYKLSDQRLVTDNQ